MEKITVYEKPTCTTCRKVIKILEEYGLSFERLNYYIEPLSKKQLKSLIKKMNLKPADVLRKKEKIYKYLNIKDRKYSDDDLIDLMVKYPDLMQRPVIKKGDKVIIARPPEKIKELFK